MHVLAIGKPSILLFSRLVMHKMLPIMPASMGKVTFSSIRIACLCFWRV